MHVDDLYTFGILEREDLRTVREFTRPNALGALRTIVIKKNQWERYTWRIRYQDNPRYPDTEHQYTTHYFDDEGRAVKSATRFMKRLGQ